MNNVLKIQNTSMYAGNLFKVAILAVGGLLFSGPALASTNLLLNGSFEEPAISGGAKYVIAPVGSSFITGWSVVGPEGKDVAVIDASYDLPDGSGVNFRSAEGAHWIDLTGAGANSFEGVAQTVDLAPGLYSLGFSVGNVVASVALGTRSTVGLWINGTQMQSFTNSAGDSSGVTWQQFSYSFNAAGLTTLQFLNADGKKDTLNGLDDVFLMAVPVPEPSQTAMLICGIAFIGMIVRRRIKTV